MSSSRMAIFFWIGAAYLTQAAASYCLTVFITPVFLLTAVVFFGLHGGPRDGAWAGALAGLLLELHAAGGRGEQLVLAIAAGTLSGWAARQFFRDSVFSTILLPMAWNWIFLACGDWATAGHFVWAGAGLFEPRVFACTLAASAVTFAALRKSMVKRVPRSLRWS